MKKLLAPLLLLLLALPVAAQEPNMVVEYDGSSDLSTSGSPDFSGFEDHTLAMVCLIRYDGTGTFTDTLMSIGDASTNEVHSLRVGSIVGNFGAQFRTITTTDGTQTATSATEAVNNTKFWWIGGGAKSSSSRWCAYLEDADQLSNVVAATNTNSMSTNPSNFDTLTLAREANTGDTDYYDGDLSICAAWTDDPTARYTGGHTDFMKVVATGLDPAVISPGGAWTVLRETHFNRRHDNHAGTGGDAADATASLGAGAGTPLGRPIYRPMGGN